MDRRVAGFHLSLIALIAAVACICPPAPAERPPAVELLPEDTLVMVRVPDARQLVASFQNTSIGRMAADEQLKPLIGQLYGEAVAAFAEAQERVGLSLDELLDLPQGEIVFAMIAPEKKRPTPLVLIDVGDRIASARKLLERAEAELAGVGAARSSQTHRGTKLSIFSDPEDEQRTVVLLEKETTVVAAADVDVAKQLLDAWNGEGPAENLASNDRYAAIMNRCRGRGISAQLTWFVDPIGLARTGARGNVGARAGLAFLPVLGLDGVQGVGGSMILDAGQFESVMHVHVLLDSPRSGIIEMLALASGDTTPESWVPAEVADYTTIHWDVDTTYATLGTLYDSIRGEGALARDVKQNMSEQLGVDFEQDILQQLKGRGTMVHWFEPPARFNSRATLVGLQLNDPKKFSETLAKITSQFEGLFTEETYAGKKFYQLVGPGQRAERLRPDAPPGDARRVEIRAEAPQPCLAVLDDYLLMTDRPGMLQQAIIAHRDADKSLAGELDYKLIAAKILRQPGGKAPGLVQFSRPEASFRMLYDLATSEENRKLLAEQAASNDGFRALNEALSDNPLPPFAVLSQYLAPSGGMLTNDQTGFHYMAFTLRRK